MASVLRTITIVNMKAVMPFPTPQATASVLRPEAAATPISSIVVGTAPVSSNDPINAATVAIMGIVAISEGLKAVRSGRPPQQTMNNAQRFAATLGFKSARICRRKRLNDNLSGVQKSGR